MAKRIDLSNQIFGKLTAMSIGPTIQTPSSGDKTTWFCKCDCGAEIQVKTYNLLRQSKPKTQCKRCRYKND